MNKARAKHVALDWERRTGESARAYAAFCVYRDLGAARSLNLAYGEWRRAQGGSGDPAKAAGYWAEWSSGHEWVARAAAYDGHLEALRRAAREDALRRLEERRADYELKNQDRLELRVAKIEALLDKADKHPLTDVVQEKDAPGPDGKIVAIKTKIKGLGSLSGYARLAKEANDTAAQAINGVRPAARETDDGGGGGGPAARGVFEWVRPADPDAPVAADPMADPDGAGK